MLSDKAHSITSKIVSSWTLSWVLWATWVKQSILDLEWWTHTSHSIREEICGIIAVVTLIPSTVASVDITRIPNICGIKVRAVHDSTVLCNTNGSNLSIRIGCDVIEDWSWRFLAIWVGITIEWQLCIFTSEHTWRKSCVMVDTISG